MVLTFQSLAAIVAMVFGSLMIDRIDKRRFCMAADLTLCLGLAFLSAFVALPLLEGHAVLPCLLLIGLCVGYLGPLEQTMVQDHTQSDMLGRVLLTYSASRTLLVPIGYAVTAHC